jgi:hypothetical protein
LARLRHDIAAKQQCNESGLELLHGVSITTVGSVWFTFSW